MIKVKKASNRLNVSGSMTDISFLLIIFFLVSAVFIADEGLILRLPDRTSSPVELYPDQVISIHVDEKSISVDSSEIKREMLADEIMKKISLRNDPVIIINVSGTVSYEEVMSILETAKRAGGNAFSVKYGEDKPVPVEIEGE